MGKILPEQKPIYWECRVNEHDKFWAAQIIEMKVKSVSSIKYILVRKWGAIGTKGQTMEQEYIDKYKAERALDILIREKENKGYKPLF